MAKAQVRYHPAAVDEAAAAKDWYASQSGEAAGAFLDELDRVIDRIRASPKRWAKHTQGTRRCLMRRFPFMVVYRELSPDLIQIVAVAHLQRRPGYWHERIARS